MVDTIVSRIEAPRIPDRTYRVSDFGAAGDGVADARPAVLAAIAKAKAEGGGRVVLSPGVWLSRGPIRLESRIELHLEPGAHLLFSPEPADYLPVVETRWEGTRVLGYSPLIYAKDVEDVAITGPGTIDGNARSGFHPWHPLADPDMQRLRRMGFNGVPLAERVFGAGTYLPPAADPAPRRAGGFGSKTSPRSTRPSGSTTWSTPTTSRCAASRSKATSRTTTGWTSTRAATCWSRTRSSAPATTRW